MTRSLPLAAGLAFATAACSWIAGIEDFRMSAADGSAVDPGPSGGDDAALDDVRVTSDANADSADAATGDAPPATFDAGDGSTSCVCATSETCFRGTCYPRPIATGLTLPQTLAVVGNSVVWAEPSLGTVRTCLTSGCVGAPTVLVNGLTRPMINHGGVGAVPVLFERSVAGSSVGISEIAPGPALTHIYDATEVNAAAASDAFAVWQSSASAATLMMCARSGASCVSSPGSPFPSTVTGTKDSLLAVDGSRTFLTTGTGVGSCTLPGCSDYTSFSGFSTMDAIVSDSADSVLVVPASSTNVIGWQLATTSIAAMLPAQATPVRAIAADATGIFAASSGGTFGAPRGVKPTLALRTSAAAGDIAIDPTFVYWTEPAAGRIMVTPR